MGRSSGLWPSTRRAALGKLAERLFWRVEKPVVCSGPSPRPQHPVPPLHRLHPNLGFEEGLHRQELHQPLLYEAQEEAYVPVSHVDLDP